MLVRILLVGVGGFLGSICRYGLSLVLGSSRSGFPFPTFVANLTGCFLIGLCLGYALRHPAAHPMLLLALTTGFCGGFTTFSTFSREGFLLLQGGAYGLFALYTLLTLLLGIILVLLGVLLLKP